MPLAEFKEDYAQEFVSGALALRRGEISKPIWTQYGYCIIHMDERGYVFISGRKKEMINRGGENIYPREIEIPLEGHPKIADVAVIGAPDPSLGERVRACVILREGCRMTPEEVKDYLRERIAKYKLPEFVEFMTEFPRNPTGKVRKKELKKMFS